MNDLFKKGIDGKVVCEKCNQEFKCYRISNRKRPLERAHPEELKKIKMNEDKGKFFFLFFVAYFLKVLSRDDAVESLQFSFSSLLIPFEH